MQSGLQMMLKALGLPDISELAPFLQKVQVDLAAAAEFVKAKFSTVEFMLAAIDAHDKERHEAAIRCIEAQNRILGDQILVLSQQLHALAREVGSLVRRVQKEAENGNNTKAADSGGNRTNTNATGRGGISNRR